MSQEADDKNNADRRQELRQEEEAFKRVKLGVAILMTAIGVPLTINN